MLRPKNILPIFLFRNQYSVVQKQSGAKNNQIKLDY